MYSMAALYRRRAHSSTGKPVVFCLRPHKKFKDSIFEENPNIKTNKEYFEALKNKSFPKDEKLIDQKELLQTLCKIYPGLILEAFISMYRHAYTVDLDRPKECNECGLTSDPERHSVQRKFADYLKSTAGVDIDKNVNSQPPKGGGFKPLDACKAS